MRPCIPPAALAVLCRKTQDEQALAIGMSVRQFTRLIRRGWERWNVGRAERWCRVCGVDFWDMAVSEKIKEVDWKEATGPKQRALRGILRMATGKEPTAAEVKALAAQLTRE
jgi:hypothetical protein